MELMVDKYKQTDIGVIPENWDVVNLGDIAKVVGGSTPKTSDLRFWNGEINWFTPTEIGTKKYVSDSKRKLSEMGLSSCSATILPAGTILLTSRAGIGDVAILTNEACTNQGFQSLIPSDYVNGEFLYYLISTKKGELLKNASGSTFLEISPSKVRSIKLPLPPHTEQTAIATALSDMDALISNLEKLIEKKRMIKQGAMQELLTGECNNGSHKSNWDERPIGSYLSIKHGKDQKQIQNLTGKYPILGTSGIIGWTDKFLYDKPSVLIGRKGTIDKPQYFDTPFWTIDTLFYSEIKDNCDPKFLYYKFQMIPWKNFNEASGVPSLSSKQVESISIRCPKEVKEQIEIREIIDSISNEIDELEHLRGKYSLIKQGMMQSLLIGKIRLL